MVESRPSVNVLCLGDIYLGTAPLRVGQDIREAAAEADLVIANLESPLSDRGQPHGPKSVHLRSSPDSLHVLKDLSVGLVCLANNHITDWGPQALLQTIELLSGNGIRTVGAGMNRSQAETAAILECKGLRLGVLAFGWESIDTLAAGEGCFGAAPINEERMPELVRALRSKTDFVMVQMHWGCTNYHYPLPEHVALGRGLIDAGAGVVVGHHPHVVQGWERWAEGAVLYSLGNLTFAPYARGKVAARVSRENHLSLLARIMVSRKGMESVEFLHGEQTDRPRVLRLSDERLVRRRDRFVRRLSRNLQRKRYDRFFRWYALRRLISRTVRWFNPVQWKSLHMDHLRSLPGTIKRIVKARG